MLTLHSRRFRKRQRPLSLGTSCCLLMVFVLSGSAVAQQSDVHEAWVTVLREARDKDPSRDAAGAVDGIIDGGYNFHTDLEQDPWWQVDLGRPYALDRVVIWNRVSLWERARTITVRLSDDAESWREVYRHDGTKFLGFQSGQPLTVSLAGETARYLRLQLREKTMFHLDEVEVFAAESPEENIALNRFATQSSTCPHSSFKPLPKDGGFVAKADDVRHAKRVVGRLLKRIGPAAEPLNVRLADLLAHGTAVDEAAWVELYGEAREWDDRLTRARAWMRYFDPEALRLAIADPGGEVR